MDSPYNRMLLRYNLLRFRSVCEWPGCCAPATDMHEIVARHETVHNHRALDLSFAPAIVAMLCREHHEAAHSMGKQARMALLMVNAATYSAQDVCEALRAVSEVLGHGLDIQVEDIK